MLVCTGDGEAPCFFLRTLTFWDNGTLFQCIVVCLFEKSHLPRKNATALICNLSPNCKALFVDRCLVAEDPAGSVVRFAILVDSMCNMWACSRSTLVLLSTFGDLTLPIDILDPTRVVASEVLCCTRELGLRSLLLLVTATLVSGLTCTATRALRSLPSVVPLLTWSYRKCRWRRRLCTRRKQVRRVCACVKTTK